MKHQTLLYFWTHILCDMCNYTLVVYIMFLNKNSLLLVQQKTNIIEPNNNCFTVIMCSSPHQLHLFDLASLLFSGWLLCWCFIIVSLYVLQISEFVLCFFVAFPTQFGRLLCFCVFAMFPVTHSTIGTNWLIVVCFHQMHWHLAFPLS